jgi:hypothetical protein
MATNRTITSANAVFMLSIQTVYPTPIQLQQFGVDDAFTNEIVPVSETQVGVDGFGVAGYVPRQVPMTIRDLASSGPAGIEIFENWVAAMDALNDVLYANAVISMPSIGRKYTCALGTSGRYSSLADARRVLANREFQIIWLPQGPGVPAISPAPM